MSSFLNLQLDKLKNINIKKLRIQKNKNRRKKLINYLAVGCGSFIFQFCLSKWDLILSLELKCMKIEKF